MGVERREEACFCLFCFPFDYRRRRRQQHQTVKSNSCFNIPPITSVFILMLLMFSPVFPATSAGKLRQDHHVFRPRKETNKMELVKAHLMRINKPFVKSIQSPDGDTIDCVLNHHQPAFDHPKLKGTKPLDPPERPDGHDEGEISSENHQLWSLSGEECPEGTIPIRRTSEQDILRANSVKKFGRKIVRPVRRDTSSYGHEILKYGINNVEKWQHAVGYVSGNKYYGAKASINVWAPKVTNRYEFSLSQMWLISGSFGHDLNTIEAGWQVSPELYGDNRPRFFTYWTNDAYQTSGCYNLLCSGFVQTNRRVAIGAAISPISVYNGGQFDISLMIWKDPKHGNWWLEFGSGTLVGYWPASLFTHLRDHASMVQFGGEIVNSRAWGSHTSTQMGSGHFSGQGFHKASYVRNMQVVDWGNSLIPLSNFKILADHPNCYDIKGGTNRVWGNYIYYGGPGKNPRCP
ncbi:hypothetical protein LXL04_011601 [Taraxacum kok-saghyz]